MKLISEDIDSLVKKIFKNQHPLLAEIITNWTKIVGTKFYNNATPLKITISKEKGIKINILHVVAANPSVSMEIAYQQEIILERIAVYLGFKGIHKLRIHAIN